MEELSNHITMQKGQGISTSGKLPTHISQTEGSTSHCHTWLLPAGNRGGDEGGLHQFFPPPTLLPWNLSYKFSKTPLAQGMAEAPLLRSTEQGHKEAVCCCLSPLPWTLWSLLHWFPSPSLIWVRQQITHSFLQVLSHWVEACASSLQQLLDTRWWR